MKDIVDAGSEGLQSGTAVAAPRVRFAASTTIELRSILQAVNDVQRFGEAKNAVLLGLSSSGASVGAALLASEQFRSPVIRGTLAVVAALLLMSLLVALISFAPQSPETRLSRRINGQRGGVRDDDNLYYFGHLAKYAPADLARAVARKYTVQDDYEPTCPQGFDGDDDYDPACHRLDVDLARQIVVNALITSTKFHLFWRALQLFLAAVLVGAAGVVVALVS